MTRFALVLFLAALPSGRLAAWQCPDGAPPPCAGARRTPAGPVIDSATVLVAPLQPVGSDPGLRAMGADLAAIIAQNITVGDVRGEMAADLGGVPAAARRQMAGRRRAGAFVEGTLLRLGGRVRATVRLVAVKTGQELATTTIESTGDSLLSAADRLSLSLLQRWWEAQPGPHLRASGVTDSLPALRHYMAGLVAWRQGGPRWRAMMDSAARRDPAFLAPLLWLGVPTESDLLVALLGAAGGSMMRSLSRVMTSDSARDRARQLLESASASTFRVAMGLPGIDAMAQLGAGGATSPLSPGFSFIGCRGAATVRLVEMAYLATLAARSAALAGCPESLAVASAAAAFALDSSFVPSVELYFQLLNDRGDTARARTVLARVRALGRPADDAAAELASRWAAELPDTSGLILALASWRRFDALERQVPRFMAAAQRMGMTPMMLETLVPMLQAPLLLATGHHDSARTLSQAPSTLLGAAGQLPIVRWQRAVSSGAGPAEQAWLPDPLAEAALDSLVGDSLPRRIEGLAASDPRMAMIRRSRGEWVTRVLWAHGVLAVERNDLVRARRLSAALDSVAGRQLPFQALSLGLRAELALASGDTAQAEGLIGSALEASAGGAGVRYVWLGARIAAARGRRDMALAFARSITVPSRLQGSASGYYYAPALRLQGEIMEQLGRTSDAAAAYRAFVELRAHADLPLQPEVEEVRRRLARLTR